MPEEALNPTCARCKRDLSGERPVRLPDRRVYCAACCESMAADDFEMETGTSFTKWIENHPELVMQYQAGELHVRRTQFAFCFAVALLGLGVTAFGIFRYFDGSGAGRPGYIILGIGMILFFGFLAARGLVAYLRAMNFKLVLRDGVFYLRHGSRTDEFSADDVVQTCVVRPGTVGAHEGALQLRDGRMLTLDTCLSDLHALGVVMDLRFGRDFPPSADELARIRREKLRKIRGLS